ncbi:MAG: glutathione peroxidase, partial [Phycisphaerae bacterium]
SRKRPSMKDHIMFFRIIYPLDCPKSLFSKVDVKGPHQCALYRFLTSPKTDPKFPGPVKWNFEKFLIARDGAIVARFRTPVWPTSPQVVEAIKAQLAK